MEHRADLFKDMTQIGTQDILDGVRINKEDPEPVDNSGDLTQAHFDAAGLKMGPEDTWDADTEQALRDAGMYKPKPKPDCTSTVEGETADTEHARGHTQTN